MYVTLFHAGADLESLKGGCITVKGMKQSARAARENCVLTPVIIHLHTMYIIHSSGPVVLLM